MLRPAVTVFCFLSIAKLTSAAFWESPDWALSSDDEASIGYDSNLFARRNGGGDGYLEATPDLLLQRLRSSTQIKLDLSVKCTTFLTRTDLNSVDPTLDLSILYPYDEYILPTQQFDLRASRATVVDGDIGGRLRAQDLDLHWNGNIIATEKTILQGRAEFHEIDYLTPGFNLNEYGTAGLTLAFVENERLELGAGYDYEYSRSEPRVTGEPLTDFSQNLLSIRGRGEFLPKVSGNFYFGVAQTNLHGGISESDVDAEGAASVVWQLAEHSKLTLKAERRTYFSPDGNVYIPTTVGPEWTQEFESRFSATLGVDAQWIENRFPTGSRNDQAYGGYFSINNTLKKRYIVALAAAYTNQTSTGFIYNYSRATVSFSFTYNF